MDYLGEKQDILFDLQRPNRIVIRDKSFNDKWATEQQKLRDELVTELLLEYVSSYKRKSKSKRPYQFIILTITALSLMVIGFATVYTAIHLIPKVDKELGDLAAILSSYLGFAAVLIGVLKIITSYVFPENDEQYITEIVKSIQKNDLENKKEYIKAEDHKDVKK
jgi:hypothetical protein